MGSCCIYGIESDRLMFFKSQCSSSHRVLAELEVQDVLAALTIYCSQNDYNYQI